MMYDSPRFILTPSEITQAVSDSGVTKASESWPKLFILGILAGVYIAFASEASNMAAFNLLASPSTYGLGRCLAGAIFPGGLMLVVIAGTYTPFCLVTLRLTYPAVAWTVFGIVWGLIMLGIVFKLFSTGKMKYLSTAMYIAMGWIALPVIKPLYLSLPWMGIVWMFLGGIIYTLGTIFYV